jgi:4-amino-4-deoxy-L-arabinose transferase-like glycosyltransferase
MSRVCGAVSDADAYRSSRRSGGHPHVARCGWFWAWTAVGVAGALGVISLGPIALLPSVTAGLVMSRSPSASRSAFGLLAGAGLLSLYVAFVQRDGPGTTCWHTAVANGCDQHLNPIPWLVSGIVLVIGSVIAQARRMG